MAQALRPGWVQGYEPEPEPANDTEPAAPARRKRTEEERQRSRRRGAERGRLARWGLRSLPPVEEDL